jgi:thiamine-monophosphate kinase
MAAGEDRSADVADVTDVTDVTVAQLGGEKQLIERIKRRLARVASSPALILGIGDDAAAWRGSPAGLALASVDMLVEGVDFAVSGPLAAAPRRVGWKAVAGSISDIAAMGGAARYVLVSLALREDLAAAWFDRFWHGVAAAAGHFGVTVAGGDLSRAPAVVADVAVWGEVPSDRLVTRGGARPGDLLVATGQFGGAAAGLAAMRAQLAPAAGGGPVAPGAGPVALRRAVARVVQRHLVPVPRLREGPLLARHGARAMIDVSDGLAAAARSMAEAAGLGVELDAGLVPVDPAAAIVAAALGADPLVWAVAGGEEYELAAALDPAALDEARGRLLSAGGAPLTVVGRFGPPGGGFVLRAPRRLDPEAVKGFDHFAG